MRFIEKVAAAIVGLLVIVFIVAAVISANGGPSSLASLLPPTPTATVPSTPTVPRPTPTPAPTSTPFPVIRTAWIEARDTCNGSPDYGELIVPGANLWRSPGVTAGRNLPHGTKIDIVIEGPEWVAINLDGQRRYIQFFYVVDYDPIQTIAPATGERFDALC